MNVQLLNNGKDKQNDVSFIMWDCNRNVDRIKPTTKEALLLFIEVSGSVAFQITPNQHSLIFATNNPLKQQNEMMKIVDFWYELYHLHGK